ncbi:hypothetical protein DWY73_00145 [Bacteroides fragilis]|uniref:Uncharacterized protein n=2 Tax=Bacteroides fragilis TaxID=817 RepID=A0A5C6JB20_BACFG|nr:hypothetical protein HMPREF0101_01893 [Bacteroides fragilis]MZI58012.1 hypothetical protein [Enterococcus durans]BAD49434.1 hypothetical protein BF2684 [Bacteroides fragilis YCH46]KAA4791199.1 hypothetical protein F3B20_00255 [Bacteroides fragilis]KAA4801890.1 hypothetical protein F3B17_09815 [Bacteroides fragilis]
MKKSQCSETVGYPINLTAVITKTPATTIRNTTPRSYKRYYCLQKLNCFRTIA